MGNAGKYTIHGSYGMEIQHVNDMEEEELQQFIETWHYM